MRNRLHSLSKIAGACFSKFRKLLGSTSGATIPFTSLQRQGSKQVRFTILLFFFVNVENMLKNQLAPGACFSKVPKLFGRISGDIILFISSKRWRLEARKAIRKTTTCLFCKAGLLICCKGNKNKNNCKVSCLETPSFLRYTENYVTRNIPEKFRDFRETGPWSGTSIRDCNLNKSPYNVRHLGSSVVQS